ncbi:plasmid stabilization protein [Brachybacterium sp. AOP25-B2-12]|uniref:plasmid stabilization protein n=1 Tax=Brachybacterium sp. AOP25-B2-12 TaxID=3457710 RepID=UPI0040333CA9
MPEAWSAKRERQYEHVKESVEEQGRSEETAEEIAARTVNKARAQAGEAAESSRQSREDTPPSVRGGRHSHEGPQGRTRDQLYEDARRQDVEGRSKMSKAELEEAVEDRD